MRDEARELIDAFYERLILRDIISKVVPGGALLLAAIVELHGPTATMRFFTEMGVFLWLFQIGVSWIAGFSFQALGEISRYLRSSPAGESRQEFFKTWMLFGEKASPRMLQQAERLNIVREASGNASVGLLIFLIFFIQNSWQSGFGNLGRTVIVAAVLIIASVALNIAHRTYVKEHAQFLNLTLSSLDK